MDDKKETRISVPYVAYESSMVRLERTNRRVWILCIILIIALLATNIGWIIYESQWQYVDSTQIEAEQDGSGVNIVGNGDIHYGPESDSN